MDALEIGAGTKQSRHLKEERARDGSGGAVAHSGCRSAAVASAPRYYTNLSVHVVASLFFTVTTYYQKIFK